MTADEAWLLVGTSSAETAQNAAKPIDDMRGTAKQRVHLIGVLTKRALRKAIERAKGA